MHSLSKSWFVVGVMFTTALCASTAFAGEEQQRQEEPRVGTPHAETKTVLLGCGIVIESLLCPLPLVNEEKTYASI